VSGGLKRPNGGESMMNMIIILRTNIFGKENEITELLYQGIISTVASFASVTLI
jgi:hypothetical protein